MTYRDERDRLILENQDLVKSIASQMKASLPKWISLQDMIGYGYLVLVECAMRFDKTRGVAFRTYARTRIRGGIKDALYREDMIPRSVRRAASKNGTSRSLPRVMSMNRATDDCELGREHGNSWSDLLADRSPQVLDHITKHEFPDGFMRSLQRMERRVLDLCFVKSFTARKAAAELGFSPTRICQIRAQVVAQARKYYTEHGFARM